MSLLLAKKHGSPLALSFALQVADGKRRIEYPLSSQILDAEDPAAEYAQVIHVERERFPSLDIVAAEPEIYSAGLRRNENLVGGEIEELQSRLQRLGALAPKQQLPEKLVAGRLFEAFDAYAEEDVMGHNVWAGSNRLKQSGHRRLEMIARFKERHEDMPLSFLRQDACKMLIRYLRPKTGVFGEWLLWPETIQILEWGLERSRRFGSELLFVSERGEPWYNELSSKNPQAKFTNVFNALIKRVQKSEPEFRRLPFGTLRDTLPNILRIHHSSEMASICLAHGSTFRGDKLIDCYTNKPFGRFHDLMRTSREYLAPVFDAAPADPTAPQIQEYIPLKTRERMRELILADVAAAVIATECKVSMMTVYREKKRLESHH